MSTQRTTDGLAQSRLRRACPPVQTWQLILGTLILAALAFLLSPTGNVSTRSLVQAHGLPLSTAPTATAGDVIGGSLALARPGSTLDVTGDVTGIGQGSPSRLTMNGLSVLPDSILHDGAVLVVGHGSYCLEGITKKNETIPSETVFEGQGAVVTMVQQGTAGTRAVYRGEQSGRQAAVFTLTPAQNTIVRRTNATKPGQKLVALTFDDGPSKYTQDILDALAASQAPATFFVLGKSAADNSSMIAKMRNAGHEIENHTWSHPALSSLSAAQIESEITRTSNAIGGSRFLRPPYGAYDAQVAAVAGNLGLRLVLWTVDTLDWKNRDATAILSRVKSGTEPGGIILMHDGGGDRSQTAAAIPRVVQWLLANGYSLTTVAKLLEG